MLVLNRHCGVRVVHVAMLDALRLRSTGMQDAATIVRTLGMKPHPEGGWYVEIHRSPLRVVAVGLASPDTPHAEAQPARAHHATGGSRAAVTSIYYLLEQGQRSHWHRVDADEIWSWHGGAAMELSIAPPQDPRPDVHAPARAASSAGAALAVHRVGMDLAAGERPQAAVPAHAWQCARPLGAWSLVGCAVAPGFEFAHFEMAPPGWSPRQA
jgi:predicted cupin superfamily sugar epimerase